MNVSLYFIFFILGASVRLTAADGEWPHHDATASFMLFFSTFFSLFFVLFRLLRAFKCGLCFYLFENCGNSTCDALCVRKWIKVYYNQLHRWWHGRYACFDRNLWNCDWITAESRHRGCVPSPFTRWTYIISRNVTFGIFPDRLCIICTHREMS